MQLTADNIACVRGGREVFAGLNFSVGSGEALLVTGRNKYLGVIHLHDLIREGLI